MVLAIWAAPVAAQEAPFCAVTAMSAQCHFYSTSACWQAIQGLDGQCVANPAAIQRAAIPPTQVMAPPPIQVQAPNILGSFLAGQHAGADARLREAEIRYLEAQIEAQRQAREPVTYICIINPATWESVESTVPGPGCIAKPR